MGKSNLKTATVAVVAAMAVSASFLAGTAYGQRGAPGAEVRSAAVYIKLRDGRLVRPLSATVQAKIDATVNGAPRVSAAGAAAADLDAGRKACIASCQKLKDSGPIEAEQCEPMPGAGNGTVLGYETPLGGKPCKTTKTVSLGADMLVAMCEQHCNEKYQLPK